MIEIILISVIIIFVLLIPTKKKSTVSRYDDRTIQFINGKVMLVEKENR